MTQSITFASKDLIFFVHGKAKPAVAGRVFVATNPSIGRHVQQYIAVPENCRFP